MQDSNSGGQSFGFGRGALRGISRGGFIPKQSGLAVNDFGDNSLFNRDNKDYAPPSSGIRGFGRGAGASFGRGGEVGSGNFVPSAQEDNHASYAGQSFGRGNSGSSAQGGNYVPLPAQSFGRRGDSSSDYLERPSSFGGSVFSSRGGQGGNRSRGGAFGSSINNEDFSSGYGSSFGKTVSSFGGSNVNRGENRNQFSSNEDTRGGNRFQDTGEGRPPPRNFAPPARRVDDLFKEDADHAESYALIADDDEEVTVSGANIEHTAIVESWKDAGFQPKLFFNIVERAKYIRPRKIQAMTIPFIMDGRDVKGHAETGSGKTAAFLLPIINQIIKSGAAENSEFGKPSPHAIIVEPTRELCLQVYEQGLKFASDTGVFVTRSYGQFNMRQNMEELQVGCDILCATPGRLKHFIMSNLISLKNLEVFVLDEADNLLQDTFLDDVRALLEWPGFPKKDQRQTLLFSATFPSLIQKLSAEVLKPDSVMISNKKLVSANSRVAQRFMLVAKEGKKDALLELLQKEIEDSKTKDPQNPTLKRTLVFVRTKRDADLISLYLSGKDIKATTINGDRPQALREQALREFRNNEVKVLVATDVCARGLDIKDLDHVINFDLPNDDVTYVHRIGRTGRIRNGVATSFFDEYDPNDCNLAAKLVEFVRGVGQEPPEFLRKVVDGSGLGSYQEKAAVAQQADDGW